MNPTEIKLLRWVYKCLTVANKVPTHIEEMIALRQLIDKFENEASRIDTPSELR